MPRAQACCSARCCGSSTGAQKRRPVPNWTPRRGAGVADCLTGQHERGKAQLQALLEIQGIGYVGMLFRAQVLDALIEREGANGDTLGYVDELGRIIDEWGPPAWFRPYAVRVIGMHVFQAGRLSAALPRLQALSGSTAVYGATAQRLAQTEQTAFLEQLIPHEISLWLNYALAGGDLAMAYDGFAGLKGLTVAVRASGTTAKTGAVQSWAQARLDTLRGQINARLAQEASAERLASPSTQGEALETWIDLVGERDQLERELAESRPSGVAPVSAAMLAHALADSEAFIDVYRTVAAQPRYRAVLTTTASLALLDLGDAVSVDAAVRRWLTTHASDQARRLDFGSTLTGVASVLQRRRCRLASRRSRSVLTACWGSSRGVYCRWVRASGAGRRIPQGNSCRHIATLRPREAEPLL